MGNTQMEVEKDKPKFDFTNPDFNTPGIKFKVESYEEYLERVKEFMPDCFGNDNRDSVIRIPPGYKAKIMEWLKENYPQYTYSDYEMSGIYIQGDLEANIRYASEQVGRMGMINADPKFMEEVCLALKEKYPNKKFEVQNDEEIYKGTNFKHSKDGRSIIVDDFEISCKWQPSHLGGEIGTWIIEKVTKQIKKGNKIFWTDHNQELIKILEKKEEFKDMSFEIKLYSEVFYWKRQDPEFFPSDTTVIIVDQFIPPAPKAYNGINKL